MPVITPARTSAVPVTEVMAIASSRSGKTSQKLTMTRKPTNDQNIAFCTGPVAVQIMLGLARNLTSSSLLHDHDSASGHGDGRLVGNSSEQVRAVGLNGQRHVGVVDGEEI